MSASDQPYALWMWLPAIRHWMQVGGGTELEMRHARLVAIAVASAFGQRAAAFMVDRALPIPTTAPAGDTAALVLPHPRPFDGTDSEPRSTLPVVVWRPVEGSEVDYWEIQRDTRGDVDVFPPQFDDDETPQQWREFALALVAATQHLPEAS